MVCCWRAWTTCAMTFVFVTSWLFSSSWNASQVDNVIFWYSSSRDKINTVLLSRFRIFTLCFTMDSNINWIILFCSHQLIKMIKKTDNGWLATWEKNWIERLFQRKSSFQAMSQGNPVTKKILTKNMKKVLYLKRSFMEAKLITILMTMTFYFDETLLLYL